MLQPTVREYVFKDVESKSTVVIIWARNSIEARQIVAEDHPYATWELTDKRETMQ